MKVNYQSNVSTQFQVLSEPQCEEIYFAMLHVLEKTGVDVYSDQALQLLKENGYLLVLIKPQFEAGRREVGKGGVVRDPVIHRRVIMELIDFAQKAGFVVSGVMASPLIGPSGNREFLMWLGGPEAPASDTIERWVDVAINSAHTM